VVGVDTMVLGVDTKKLHLLHQMHRESSSVSSAAVEMLILNVDRDSGRTVPIPETPLLQLRNLAAAHSREPAPSMIGRVITFHRAK
jgi:acyl-CoA thioester hydrolase